MLRKITSVLAGLAMLAVATPANASIPTLAIGQPKRTVEQTVAPCIWEAGILTTVNYPATAQTQAQAQGVVNTCTVAAGNLDEMSGQGTISLDVYLLSRDASYWPIVGSPLVDTAYWLDSVRSQLAMVEGDLCRPAS